MALLNSIQSGGSSTETVLKPSILSSGGRGRALAPIVRVGIPPPGAIILNGGQASLALRGRGMYRKPFSCNK